MAVNMLKGKPVLYRIDGHVAGQIYGPSATGRYAVSTYTGRLSGYANFASAADAIRREYFDLTSY